MRHRIQDTLALLSTIGGLCACSDRADLWDRALDIVGPVETQTHLAWLNRSSSVLITLDPSESEGARAISLAQHSRTLAGKGSTLYVLGGSGADPVLQLVDPSTGELRVLALPGPYDAIAASSDGLFAVLSYDPNQRPPPGGAAARNNNEVAIVDIAAEKVTRLQLETESLAPQAILFSPEGRLSAVVLDSAVAFIDLSSASNALRVPLKLPDGRELTPRKARFSETGDFLFLRADESDDVLAIEVSRDEGGLRAAVNFLFLAGGGRLRDIEVPNGLEHAVVALYQNGARSTAAVLDASGGTSNTLRAELSFAAAAIGDLGGGRLLLHAAEGSGARQVAGWDLTTGRLEEDRLQGPFSSRPSLGQGTAFFLHEAVPIAQGGLTSALTGVSLEADSARLRVRLSPIVLSGTPSAMSFDPDRGLCLVGITIPREDSGASIEEDEYRPETGSLVLVDATGFAVSGLPLDDPITEVGLVGGYAYALHPRQTGDLSLVPLDELDRAASLRFEDFFLAGLLDLDLGEEN